MAETSARAGSSSAPAQERGPATDATRRGETATKDAAEPAPGAASDREGIAAVERTDPSHPETTGSEESGRTEASATEAVIGDAMPAATPATAAPPALDAPARQRAGSGAEPASAAAEGEAHSAAGAGAGAPVQPDTSPASTATESGLADGEPAAPAAALAGTPPAPDAAAPPKPAPGPDRLADTAAAPSSAEPAAAPPVTLGAVPMTIGLRSMVGTNRFEMRLDPAELGRIDVTLDIDKESGSVSATLVADNPATLALLRRDADSLQQALAQAGFSAGEAGITLQLRGDDASQGHSRGETDRQDAGRPNAAGARPDAPLDAIPLRALRPAGGLDIRI